jgi:aminoglycoside 6'-N-acetyltransferase
MVVLREKRVLLRPGRPEDADRLVQIRNEPEVVRRWGSIDIEEEISEEFIEADDGFVIEADGEVVGTVQYHQENEPMYRHADMDIFLATSRHGQGLGAEALRLLAHHLFEERGRHRLTIDPAAYNTTTRSAPRRRRASQRCRRKLRLYLDSTLAGSHPPDHLVVANAFPTWWTSWA